MQPSMTHFFPLTFLEGQSRAPPRHSLVASSILSHFVSPSSALISIFSKSPGLVLSSLPCTESRTHTRTSRPKADPLWAWSLSGTASAHISAHQRDQSMVQVAAGISLQHNLSQEPSSQTKVAAAFGLYWRPPQEAPEPTLPVAGFTPHQSTNQ